MAKAAFLIFRCPVSAGDINSTTRAPQLLRSRRSTPICPTAASRRGLVKVDWPARLQRLTEGNLLRQLPPDAELWLDGGHNPQAGHALSSALADLEEKAPKPLLMIIGMLVTKKPHGYFAPFKGLAREIITVPIPGSHTGVDPVELASMAQQAGIPASAAASLEEALKRFCLQQHDVAPRILIGGSLYLAGFGTCGQRHPSQIDMAR